MEDQLEGHSCIYRDQDDRLDRSASNEASTSLTFIRERDPLSFNRFLSWVRGIPGGVLGQRAWAN